MAENEFEWEILKKQYAGFTEQGIPVSLLDAKELQDEEPGLAKDLYGGILTKTSGCLYPIGYTYALCLGVEKLGGDLMLHTKVTGIKTSGDHSFKISTTRGDVTAANVVNCGGVWSDEIGRMVGLRIPVQPRHGMILVAEQSIKPASRKIWGSVVANAKNRREDGVERNHVAMNTFFTGLFDAEITTSSVNNHVHL